MPMEIISAFTFPPRDISASKIDYDRQGGLPPCPSRSGTTSTTAIYLIEGLSNVDAGFCLRPPRTLKGAATLPRIAPRNDSLFS